MTRSGEPWSSVQKAGTVRMQAQQAVYNDTLKDRDWHPTVASSAFRTPRPSPHHPQQLYATEAALLPQPPSAPVGPHQTTNHDS